MSIASSSYTLDGHDQKDGRKYVRESHTDHLGVVYAREYLAPVGADYSTLLADYAAALAAALRDGQARDNLSKDSMTEWIFEHVTVGQMRTALRLAYRDATKFEAARLARFVNELTIGQIETVFNVNTATATAIKNKASDLASRYDALLVAVGD